MTDGVGRTAGIGFRGIDFFGDDVRGKCLLAAAADHDPEFYFHSRCNCSTLPVTNCYRLRSAVRRFSAWPPTGR
jgi:hypothetical protein